MLSDLSRLRTTSYVNKNGTRSKGKLWLPGLNECTLDDVKIDTSRHGNVYIVCTFRRKPAHVHGLVTKISFAPHTEYVFGYERAKEICHAFGHDLVEAPHEMPFNDYFRHVYRRMVTFIGSHAKVVVSVCKEARRDEYGFAQVTAGRCIMKGLEREYEDREVVDWRMNIHFTENVDWFMLYNILHSR